VSRERVLLRRLRTLETLDEAVGALRALSAQHFRAVRGLVPAARAYRDEVAASLGVLGDAGALDGEVGAPPGVVLVAADLGLVGDYVPRLVHEALALRAEQGAGPLFCLGHRAVAPLERAAVRADRVLDAPTTVASLPGLLLPLVDEILAARRSGALGALWLVAARFEGAGRFSAVRVPVLPVAPPPASVPLATSPYGDRAHLRAVVVRESLYAALYETLLGALASEHGKRLVTAESARTWLRERIAAMRRRVSAIRREASTQEVLEVTTAARAARREREGGWTHRP
jgi:F0F1-type ATP synthase gamma subunit